MKLEKLLDEIRELNLAYLMLAKEMIREDKAEAIYRLGISSEIADMVAALSTGQLLKIATSNLLLCRFRFDDQVIWDLITSHTKEHGLGNVHAAILMGSRAEETL
ncbi:MAG: flagellar transcriptional regulator FlhD [Pseudomonadota bacterium]